MKSGKTEKTGAKGITGTGKRTGEKEKTYTNSFIII
jgi:hypothetical protein